MRSITSGGPRSSSRDYLVFLPLGDSAGRANLCRGLYQAGTMLADRPLNLRRGVSSDHCTHHTVIWGGRNRSLGAKSLAWKGGTISGVLTNFKTLVVGRLRMQNASRTHQPKDTVTTYAENRCSTRLTWLSYVCRQTSGSDGIPFNSIQLSKYGLATGRD